MPRHSRAHDVADPGPRSDMAQMETLAPDLQKRLVTVEAHSVDADFDAWSWTWMILLGLVLPAVLLAIGWWL